MTFFLQQEKVACFIESMLSFADGTHSGASLSILLKCNRWVVLHISFVTFFLHLSADQITE
jgi:hypothetical protein